MWILNHTLWGMCMSLFCFFYRVILSISLSLTFSIACEQCVYEIRGEIKSHFLLAFHFILFYHLVAIFIKEFYLMKKINFFSAALAAAAAVVVVVAILQFSNFLKALKRGLFIFNAYISPLLWRRKEKYFKLKSQAMINLSKIISIFIAMFFFSTTKWRF